MESKKINQLATELTPALSDLTIIGDPTTGISKKITLSQMASLFTGTVEEYANFAAFPLVGVADTIYIALDTNVLYRWNTGTSAYVELSPNIINSLVFSDANGFDGNISLVGSVATLTITTALTTGSVPFIGASGALSQDNVNLFFDDTNNRLGINTNSPTTALDVFGSGIIGRLNGTSTNNAFLGFASAGTNRWSIGNVQSDHRFRIYNEATTSELISILSTGEFGIGIANPTTKFHIDGAASALIANLDANVSVAKSLSFRSDNSNRINLEVSGTESGSNAGANFFIRRYSDAGSLIDTPLTIMRSTGTTTFTGNVIQNINDGTISLYKADGTTPKAFLGNPDGSNTDEGYLELYKTSVSKVKIRSNGNSYLNGGNVGINQGTPLNQLHILGIGTSIYTDGLRIERNGVPSQYGIFNYTGGSYNYLAVNTTTGEPGYYWLTSVNGTSSTTRMTLNVGSFMLDVTGTGRFSSELTVTGRINANGSGEQIKIGGVGIVTEGAVAISGSNMYLTDFATYTKGLILNLATGASTFSGAATFNGNTINLNGNNPSLSLATTAANLYSYIGFAAGTASGSIFQLGNTYASTGPYLSSALVLTADSSGGISISASESSAAIRFYTNGGNERMRIIPSGYLKIAPNAGYIGAGDAFHELHSNSNNSDLLYLRHTTASPYGLELQFSGGSPNNTSNWFFYAADTTNPKAIIYSNGTFGSRTGTYGSIISDEKYKQDILDASSQWDDIKNLRVVNFKFKQDVELEGETALRQIGFIAQEVEKVSPNLVYESTDRDSGETWKSVKTSIIEIKAIKALQEAMAKIEILEQKVKQLETK